MGFHAFGDFTMTRLRFNAMPEHMKTEFSLLVKEWMVQQGDDRQLDPVMERYCGMRHAYALPGAIVVDELVEAGIGERIENAERKPRVAAQVLAAIAVGGGQAVRLSKDDLSIRLAVSARAIEKAVSKLQADGLVSRTGAVNTWSLTACGRDLIRRIEEDA